MPKTLLLADDSVTIQKVVGISFANEDVVLLTVDNGDDAVAKAQQAHPDIVLADVVMPGKNGYEVCEAIKQDSNLKHTPVLLLTGTFEAFDEDRARSAGADGHITKPFEAQALVDQVNSLLARSAPAAATATAPAESDDSQPAAATEAKATPAESYDFFDDEVTEPGTTQPGAAPPPEDDLGLGDTGDQSFRFEPTPDLGEELEVTAQPGPGPAPTDSADETMILPAGTDAVASGPGATSATSVQSFASEASTDLEAGEPTAEPVFDALDEVPTAPSAAGAIPGGATLDPEHGRDYDVSSTDLGPIAEGPTGASAEVPATDYDPDQTMVVSEPLVEAPASEPEPPVASTPIAEPPPIREAPSVPMAPPISPSPPELPAAGPPPVPTATEEPPPIPSAEAIAEAEPVTAAPAAPTSGASANLSHEMREEIRATVEKVAWEAFGRVTESLVKESVERIEKVAWEVVPQLAETLVQEEIRRLKGDD